MAKTPDIGGYNANELLGLIARIEKQCGKSIADISSKSEEIIDFEGEKIALQSLFNRFAHICGSKSRATGKQFLIAMKEHGDFAEAMEVTQKEQQEKEIKPQPIPMQLISASVLLKMESLLGKKISDFTKKDTDQKTIEVGGMTYTFSPRYLLRRVTDKGGSTEQAREYLELIAKGSDPKVAFEKVGMEMPAPAHQMKHTKILTNEELVNIGHSLEGQLGTTVAEITTKANGTVDITTENYQFNGRVRSLLDNLGNRLQCTRGEVLARIKNLLTGEIINHRQILDKDFFDAVLTSEGINQLESLLGFAISNSSTKDRSEIEMSVNGNLYHFKFSSFLQTVASIYLGGKSKRGIARAFLQLIKEGEDINTAIVKCRFFDKEKTDREFEQIAQVELEEAIALLQNDPLKLKLYLQFAHPEISDDQTDQLVVRSFKGLVTGSNESKENEYLGWDEKLRDVSLEMEIPETTEEETITLSGQARDADCVYIAGCWNRRVRVDQDGRFTVSIPLKIGEENEIRVMSLNRGKQIRSEQQYFIVDQEGEADDIAALIGMLSELRTDLLKGIQKDPGRMKFFVSCTERVLIKKFGRSFDEGKKYISMLIAGTESKMIQEVLAGVLENFEAINRMKIPNVKEGSLMFFQKYCIYAIRKRMANGMSGLILANDPGLGKTRTILAALADEEAAIFTPNSVVSSWDEESNEIFRDPDLLVMRDIPHETRKQLLRNGEHLHLVTNVQFLRNTADTERFVLLSNDETVVVHDEAHSRANEQSEQSKGAKMLKHKFQINVSATPFKNTKTFRRILSILEPDDPRFQSDAAFEAAFPSRDADALKALSLLKEKYTIRFRKQDVMEEVDPNIPLSQQLHRLPRKEYVSPEKMGQFEMSEDQSEAIYEMFLNWPKWCTKYDKYIPKDEVAEEDRLRSGGALTKRHALRQTVNNPSYIGSDAEDEKAKQMERIVKQCLKEGRKIVIFCSYNAQALKYAEMFKKYKPALYTGITSEEGEKKDVKGQPLKFAREKAAKGKKRGWAYNARGYPKEDPTGETMSALDYERLSFQHSDERDLIIATYQAGAVGTTFTAGKAMIFDDVPADCIEAIQAEDRIHRIDHEHQTHHAVKYFTLQSQYPDSFLEKMKKRWVVRQLNGSYKEYRSLSAAQNDSCISDRNPVATAFDVFFAQGTYDQVNIHNLRIQKQMFHLINDGIADESILNEEQEPFAGL